MKLGVITDGIDRDLEHSLKVMNETGLEYAELQFLWDKEIGDQTPEEIQKIKELVAQYNVKVPIITRHNFRSLCQGGFSSHWDKIASQDHRPDLHDHLAHCI